MLNNSILECKAEKKQIPGPTHFVLKFFCLFYHNKDGPKMNVYKVFLCI